LDQRAIVDVVCKTGLENLSGEIGALLGQELTCSDIQLDLTTKSALFNNPERQKTALVRMTVSGDHEGQSYLLHRISSAAILGGTLIMLPEDVIEENAQDGTLDGELNDAFSEVANIIAGVFTQAFVDKYKKSLRFVKNSVEELVPTKIDPDSDAPFPPGNYYLASCRLSLEEQDLGPLEFVVPAAIFELEEDTPDEPEASVAENSVQETSAPTAEATSSEQQPAAQDPTPAEDTPPKPTAPAEKKPAFAEAKKLADVVLNATISQAGEEIGALLGQTLECNDVRLVMTSKADFFSQHCLDKSIITRLQISGDKEGTGYLLLQVPDAVLLGGTLIMLPQEEIESQMSAGSLDGEAADAFGEIANILAGSLTQVFLDRYPKKIRFVKTDSDTVVPTKIDVAAGEPFPEGSYYLASFTGTLEGQELNPVQLIFPAEIFDLDDYPPQTGEQPASEATPEAAPSPQTGPQEGPAPGDWGGPPLPQQEQPSAATAASPPASQAPVEGQSAPAPPTNTAPGGHPLVLVISDKPEDAEFFTETLKSAGYQCQLLNYQDELKKHFQAHPILGIFLIMAQVGEKGFAAAIKLQSAGRPLPPLIFAGPEWTRSAVLRAVKYGAKDILVTPASGDEIQKKASQHLQKAS
jgi:chemotaxis protein CheY-P-specific phosphatase CheC